MSLLFTTTGAATKITQRARLEPTPLCQAPDGAPSWPPTLKRSFRHVAELSIVVSTTAGRSILYPHALAQLLICRRQISRASSRLAGGHLSVTSLPSSRVPPPAARLWGLLPGTPAAPHCASASSSSPDEIDKGLPAVSLNPVLIGPLLCCNPVFMSELSSLGSILSPSTRFHFLPSFHLSSAPATGGDSSLPGRWP